jgi:hypothetical protein
LTAASLLGQECYCPFNQAIGHDPGKDNNFLKAGSNDRARPVTNPLG